MSEQPVLLSDLSEGILTLTLNRADALNAFSRELLDRFALAVEEANFHQEARVLIVTGAGGGKASFSTGADLKERATMSEDEVRRFIFKIRNTFTALENLRKPVIAAVNGFAFGGGLELALACDIRIAAAGALMGLTETSLAIIPGAGGTQRLPRIVGIAKAKELIFTARRITAEEALAIGLVNQVVPGDKLLETARKLALQICENGPIAIQQAKFAVSKGMDAPLEVGLNIESNAYWLCIPTEDRQEGLRAFREKRKPRYQGK
ncbi:MAG: enoyl-CoA hydratase-related protein [bacterium]